MSDAIFILDDTQVRRRVGRYIYVSMSIYHLRIGRVVSSQVVQYHQHFFKFICTE